MYALLNVAFALLAGLLMTRIFSRWRLPDVTAFLVAGVLIGPFCLGRLGITGVGFAATCTHGPFRKSSCYLRKRL